MTELQKDEIQIAERAAKYVVSKADLESDNIFYVSPIFKKAVNATASSTMACWCCTCIC